MVALKDLWRAQHQQRQQETIQRQQQVRAALALIRQERHHQALQVRAHLNTFRSHLAQENEIRLANQHLFQLQLQQQIQQLQQKTQVFLDNVREIRQIQAKQLAQQLDEFVQALQQQTQSFLELTAAERSLMAQQLNQDLQRFHIHLSQTVIALRQDLQRQLAVLHQETQTTLAAHQQNRQALHLQQAQQLAEFIEQLRSDVQSYLQQLGLERQERAEELQNLLAQARNQRQTDVAALFGRFADFRVQLQQFHTSLQDSVWGTTDSLEPLIGLATKAESLEPVDSAVTSTASSLSSKTTTVETAQTSATNAVPSPLELEKSVYNYLYQVQGARLAEIESVLALNRFQTVDALSSLITKGLVIQRDRIYYIQEEFGL